MNKIKLIATTMLLTSIFLYASQSAEQKNKVENFTLKDTKGVKHSLTDFKSSKAIVLMFIATRCPVSNAYNSRFEDLQKEYWSKGITFIGINSNKQESVEEIKDHAAKNGFTFTILKDNDNVIADRLDATVTPEIFVLSPQFEILYHGRVDDSRNQANVSSQDLRIALDAILSNKPVTVKETKSFGCTIKRVDKG